MLTANSSNGSDELKPSSSHSARLIGKIDLWEIDGWSVKAYGVNHQTDRSPNSIVDEAQLDAAKNFARQSITIAAKEGGHYRCGFLIVHQATNENWFLFDWWTYDNVIAQQPGRSYRENPAVIKPVSSSIIACVYELAVIDFERRCWIDTVLRDGGSITQYMSTWMKTGLY